MDNKKIIIVDNNIDQANLLGNAFIEQNPLTSTIYFTNQVDLFEYFSLSDNINNIALILLDFDLASEEGIAILKKMSQQVDIVRLPVIVLINAESIDLVETCYNSGANAVTYKPTNTEETHQTVKAISQFWLDINVLPISNIADQMFQH